MSIGSAISLVIEVGVVVLLVWAVARRGLIRPTAVPQGPVIAVVGTVVVALVLAFVFDVPDPLPWLTGLLFVLLALTRLASRRRA